MKLIVDIPDEQYNLIKLSDKSVFADASSKECMMYVIKNGIPYERRPQGEIRWTDKVYIKDSGDITDFYGRVVGHINLEDIKGGAVE